MEANKTRGRIPPHSIEAEQCTLGSMLLDEEAIAVVFGALKADDFYRNEHKDIFNAIDELYSSGKSVDIVTLGEALRKSGNLVKCGGLEYLATLAEQVPSAASAHHYAEIVEDKAILRTLIKSSGEILEMGYENQEDARKVMDFAQQNIFDLAQAKDSKGVSHIRDVLEENLKTLTKLYKEGNRVPGIASGYPDLDEKTSGFQPSDLILIAGRPSMGKSALALNIAQHVAINEGMSVAIFSLEMSKEQVVNRILSSEIMIENKKLKIGDISSDEWQKIAVASAQISEASIYIDDSSDISAAEMRAKCRRLKLKHQLDMVVIDYIQLIKGGLRNESRQQEITEISRNLKILAKDLHIPVIALSQLSRAPEQRTNHRPMLSDLRESGAIEQDADMVMFIYREDYYNKETEHPNVTELIIAKNRNGEVGDIKLRWHAEFTKFSNLAIK